MKISFIKGTACVLLALLLVPLHATPLQADVPPTPHAVYGTLICGGSAAPVGTTVTAKYLNTDNVAVVCGSIVTTVAGKYGAAPRGSPKLIIQGDLTSGITEVKFYINRNWLMTCF